MKTAKEVLQCTRELLSKPENWVQGSYARDKNGRAVFEDNPEATGFCLVGGMRKCLPPDDGPAFYTVNAAKAALAKAIGSTYITTFNDIPGRKHADILEVLDRAIASL